MNRKQEFLEQQDVPNTIQITYLRKS